MECGIGSPCSSKVLLGVTPEAQQGDLRQCHVLKRAPCPQLCWDLLGSPGWSEKREFFPPIFPDFCFQGNLGKTGYGEILVFYSQLGGEDRIFPDH